MARYCFYCGRELKPGEKCDCRQRHSTSTSRSGSTENDHKNKGKHAATVSSSSKSSRQRPFKSIFTSFTSRQSQNARKPGSQGPGPLSRGLGIVGSFMTRPVEHIRISARENSTQPIMAFVIFHSLAGGLLLLLAAEQNLLADFLSLNFVTAQIGNSFLSRLFIFIQGAGIFLISTLLLVFLYQFVLRYMLKKAIGFTRIFAGLSPANFYSGIFLLFAALLVRGSFFSALMMLAVSLAMHILVQSISLAAVSGLDDNRVFIVIATVLMLFAGIVALMFNMALPVIDALLEQVIII